MEQMYPKAFRRGNIFRIKTIFEAKKEIRVGFWGSEITKDEHVEPSQRYSSVFGRRVGAPLEAGVKCKVKEFGWARCSSVEALLEIETVMAWEPDIIFLEFSLTDGEEMLFQKSFEAVVRQLLEKGIAVVILTFSNCMGADASGHQKRVGAFYNLSVLDIGSLLGDDIREGNNTLEDLFWDDMHLTAKGHRKTAENLVLYIRMVLDTIKDNDYQIPEEYCFPCCYRKMERLALPEKQLIKEVLFEEEIEYSFLELSYRKRSAGVSATIEIWLDGELRYQMGTTSVTGKSGYFRSYLDGNGTVMRHHLRICIGDGKLEDVDLSKLQLCLGVGIQ